MKGISEPPAASSLPGAPKVRSRPSPAEHVSTARTVLFVPGNRRDRFQRALTAGADLVVVDLEDAVPPQDKDAARRAGEVLVRNGTPVAFRINDPTTPRGLGDITALARASGGRPVTLMVPKAENPHLLQAVHDDLPAGSALIALIESAVGVLDVRSLASVPGVARLAFGHLDLSAQLGVDPDEETVLASARFAVLTASVAAGIATPIDGVCVAVRDREKILSDTRRSLRAGFTAKLCIHPDQIEPVHAALAPGPDELEWARRVVDTMSEHDVGVVAGRMVDRPVYLQARAIVARASRADHEHRDALRDDEERN
ncbi:hypothetical protein AQJ91_36040 [Streptomyces dysideae]|uniref:HpcH/HpaI aldolase/citrate lyase domain-containing protein n=2 Tax=Streptomyces dysideae TaxID=909626 RepID=A0A124IDW3_9ACTN|nr:hypothetical protein AQJ91_36040 [Streptomyces dysideae]